METLQEENDRLKKLLHAMVMLNRQNRSRVEQQSDDDALKEEIRKQTEKIASLEISLAKKSTENEALTKKVEDLTNRNALIVEETEQIKAKLQQLETALKKPNDSINNEQLQKKIKDLQEELQTKKDEIIDLENKNTNKQKQIDKLAAAKDLENTNAQLTAKLAEKKQELDAEKEKYTALETSLKDLKAKIEQLEQSISQKSKANATPEAKKNTLHNYMKAIKFLSTKYKEVLSQYTSKMNQMQSKLNQMQSNYRTSLNSVRQGLKNLQTSTMVSSNACENQATELESVKKQYNALKEEKEIIKDNLIRMVETITRYIETSRANFRFFS